MRKNVLFIGMSISLLILLGLGVSYSMWNISNTQDIENVISTTECFDISITSQENSISLKNSYPISDEKGKSLTPFTFNITNTCDMAASYSVNLESLKGSTLSSQFLKVMVNNKVPKMLNQYDNVSTVNNGSVEARVLDTGTLFKNKSKEYQVRLWIDYDTTMEDLDNETKILKSKIVVTGSPTNEEEPSPMLLTDTVKEVSNSNTVDIATDDPDNNIRYIGKDPYNYVYFNCSDYNNQSDSTCEKWRIIGLFNNITKGDGSKENLVKIIRDESIGNYSWDTRIEEYVDGEIQLNYSSYWTNSSLQKLLNSGAYYNGTTGIYYNGDTTAISVDFTLTGLKNDLTRESIERVVWSIKGLVPSTGYSSDFYNDERSALTSGNQYTIWTGKIGLIYPSDYGYATTGGSNTNRSTCLTKNLENWNTLSDCYGNDYLYKLSQYQWTLAPYSDYDDTVFNIYGDGKITGSIILGWSNVYPTLYLKSNITIKDGNGFSNNPYQLGL